LFSFVFPVLVVWVGACFYVVNRHNHHKNFTFKKLQCAYVFGLYMKIVMIWSCVYLYKNRDVTGCSPELSHTSKTIHVRVK